MAKIGLTQPSLTTNTYIGAGSSYVVETVNGNLYRFEIEGTGGTAAYSKSTDGGLSWGSRVTIMTGNCVQLSVWYDRWSDISAGLIHVARTESGTDDCDYRSIDTENSDTLGTQTEIFNGTTTANGGHLSITRARGGNLYCKVVIDAGAEGGFFRSTDAGATWGSRTVDEAIATTDQMILLPGWAADNQDIMAFFWDADADEISRKLYDDSADTWGETSIATSMVDRAATNDFPHFAATVDIANSRNLLVAWSAVDLLNADLRCWHVTESAITEVTNVVANSTDDQGLCGIGIDTATGDWHVYYAGKSDGSETFGTSVTINYKVSTDDGSTWDSETAAIPLLFDPNLLVMTPRFDTTPAIFLFMAAITANQGLMIIEAPTVGGAAGGAHVLGGTVVS